ncbi:winged helix-turn-helix domain-containing protein [Streptomyces sp. NPDC057249]|uniref:winged helix-turn-helix domain-containing protein n=1 Tax=Streptomyces sp. NPDC057249 TaxID=3346067 RepID=UPI00362D9C9D
MGSATAPKAGTSRRRVYDGLKQMLTDTDAYPPGTKLPTYEEIRKQYGVSYSVVSVAMHALAAEGLVRIRHARGAYAFEVPPTKSALIAKAVRERIADGSLKPGQPLVRSLAQEFGVTPANVSKALVPLLDEGLLIVHLGVGTFVSRRHARRPKRRRAPQPPDTP